jgi:hypothetical protein
MQKMDAGEEIVEREERVGREGEALSDLGRPLVELDPGKEETDRKSVV